jgi:hypothetical protein
VADLLWRIHKIEGLYEQPQLIHNKKQMHDGKTKKTRERAIKIKEK